MDDGKTEELRAAQRRREADQKQRARTSPDKQEVAQAARRADKARYLRQKLDERADSEREKND